MLEYLWLGGGQNGDTVSAKSFKLLVTENGNPTIGSTWEPSEELPFPMAGHCLSSYENSNFLYLISGGVILDGSVSGRSFMYSSNRQKQESPWSEVGLMRVPRKLHSCLPYKLNNFEVILAIGGQDVNNMVLQSSEIFYIRSNNWALLNHQLPWQIANAHVLKMNDRLLFLGGQRGISPQQLVWSYHPSVGWRRSSIILDVPLSSHVSLSLKSADITHKNHPNILIFGGQLTNGKMATTEALCIARDRSNALDPYCDSAVTNIMDLSKDISIQGIKACR